MFIYNVQFSNNIYANDQRYFKVHISLLFQLSISKEQNENKSVRLE